MLRYKDGSLKLIWKFMLLLIASFSITLLWTIILEIAMATYGALTYKSLLREISNSIWFNYLNGAVQNIVTILIVFIFLKKLDKKNLDYIGINYNRNSIKHFALGMLLATSTLILIIILSIISGFSYFITWGFEQFSINSIISTLILGIFLCLCIGFGEEILARGYIQTNISSRYGNLTGLITAAVIFMCLHIGTYSKLLDFLDMFTAGLLLGYMYLITDSLYLSIGYHFFTDYLQICIFRFEQPIIPSSPILIFNIPQNLYLGPYNLGCKVEIYFVLINLITILFLYFFKSRLKAS